jgi:hypothetical protein
MVNKNINDGSTFGDCLFLCWYNKIPQTEYFINNSNLFLMVLEAGNSELKRPAGLVSGNELFSASKVCLAAPSRRDECFVLREGTEE